MRIGSRSDASFAYVRQFLTHFRAIGYQLVRECDYGHLDGLLRALESLRSSSLVDEEALSRATVECRRLQGFLEDLFVNIGRRTELQDVPFDRKTAAHFLKLHIEGVQERA